MKTLKLNLYFLKLIWRNCKKKVILHFLFALLQATTDFLTSVLFLEILISIIESKKEFEVYFLFATILVAIELISHVICTWYYSFYNSILDQTLNEKLSDIINRKASKIQYSYFEDAKYYNLQKQATLCTTNYTAKILNNATNIASYILAIALSLTYATIKSPLVLVFIFIPVIYIFASRNSKTLFYKISKEKNQPERQDRYVRYSFFSRDSAKELRTTNLYNLLKSMFLSANADIKSIYKKYGMKTTVFSILVEMFGTWIPKLSAYSYTAYRFVVLNNLSISDFSVLITAINTFCNRTNRLSGFLSTAYEHSNYIGDLKTFLDLPIQESKGNEIPNQFERLFIRNLSFSYDKKNKVIDNLNFAIKKGEKVAIVGENGAGKSTLIKLLLRLYEPDEGEIFYNDHPIESFELEAFRRVFGVVFQDYSIYGLSVSENIKMGAVEKSDRLCVFDSLTAVGLNDLADDVASGNNTPLTREFHNDGIVLSGGQRQKIAISRLLAREYDIAVLDEPSASLDPISEKR